MPALNADMASQPGVIFCRDIILNLVPAFRAPRLQMLH